MIKYLKVIYVQTQYLLENIEHMLRFIPEELYCKEVNGYLVWKQVYHLLNSLDRIFINSNNYKYPDFHTPKLNSLDYKSDDQLDKNTLFDYFSKIREDIGVYLEGFDDDKLLEPLVCQGMRLTRLDLILAQFRHVTWHLGYLSSCMKIETGDLPVHIGLKKEDYPLG